MLNGSIDIFPSKKIIYVRSTHNKPLDKAQNFNRKGIRGKDKNEFEILKHPSKILSNQKNETIPMSHFSQQEIWINCKPSNVSFIFVVPDYEACRGKTCTKFKYK